MPSRWVAEARSDIRTLIDFLERCIARIEEHMAALVAADPEMTAIDHRLPSAPGVGFIIAAPLIAELP